MGDVDLDGMLMFTGDGLNRYNCTKILKLCPCYKAETQSIPSVEKCINVQELEISPISFLYH